MENDENLSWAPVFLFYSCLHLIQAYITEYPGSDYSPTDHDSRNTYVSNNFPKDIAEAYVTLYRLSKAARYKLRTFSRSEIREIHDKDFSIIRKYFRDTHNIYWDWLATNPIQKEKDAID